MRGSICTRIEKRPRKVVSQGIKGMNRRTESEPGGRPCSELSLNRSELILMIGEEEDLASAEEGTSAFYTKRSLTGPRSMSSMEGRSGAEALSKGYTVLKKE